MMQLDHIAFSGVTLIEATEAVESALGVVMQPGGRHDVFGTHNTLLRLDQGLYLEAIAADPSAPRPGRPRWFDLDNFSGAPRLTNWICRTDDIARTLEQLGPDAGQPVALRRKDLRWLMAVPSDGRLPYDNLFPALIQWQTPVHPSAMLARTGCALRRLIVTHPEAGALQDLLSPVFQDTRVTFEVSQTPSLAAEIDTPHGRRILQ